MPSGSRGESGSREGFASGEILEFVELTAERLPLPDELHDLLPQMLELVIGAGNGPQLVVLQTGEVQVK
jgi:hypothetical protein